MTLEFRIRDLLYPPLNILHEAGVRFGMRVLDLGCGPGSFSIAAARLVGTEGFVWAVDIHPLAIKYVKKGIKRWGLANIRTLTESQLGEIPEESVDMVLIYDLLHDLEDPASALGESHRTLKNDGILSVRDHRLGEKELIEAVSSGGKYLLNNKNQFSYTFNKVIQGEAIP